MTIICNHTFFTWPIVCFGHPYGQLCGMQSFKLQIHCNLVCHSVGESLCLTWIYCIDYYSCHKIFMLYFMLYCYLLGVSTETHSRSEQTHFDSHYTFILSPKGFTRSCLTSIYLCEAHRKSTSGIWSQGRFYGESQM